MCPNDAKWRTTGRSESDVPVEDRYLLLIDAVQDYAIFMLDPTGHIARWNSGAQKIKGYGPDEIMGRHFSIFYPPEDIEAGKPQRELALAEAQGRVEDEGWRVRRDGSRFWANVVITAVRDPSGKLLGFAKVTRDMTEQKRLAELEHASELSAQIQSVREEEQKRIARELHDDLGQQLTALKMGIAMLEDASESGLEPAQVAAQSRLLQRQIDSMMASIRRIASDLRPPMLDDLGLIAAVEWLADDFTHRSHVDVTTDLQMQDIALTKFAATAIFRMVQEALTNVARHAAATEVRISMSHTDEFCSVTIDDDGRGATLDDPSRRRSFGLLGMRERARQLNGTLSIVSAPGQGFRLSIRLPINAISSDAAE